MNYGSVHQADLDWVRYRLHQMELRLGATECTLRQSRAPYWAFLVLAMGLAFACGYICR